MKRIFVDQDGNAFEYEDGKPASEKGEAFKSGKNTIHMNGGNYTQKIKGDYIQGSVVSSSTPTPTPPRKDYSGDGDAIDV